MLDLPVINLNKEKIEDISLDESIFNVEEKPHLVHMVVRMQLARKRRGTVSTKERGDVAGSTIKLYRQKGTGRARRGSAKSPLLKGGGIVFGPHPRDFSIKVPRKIRKEALRSAISSKIRENSLLIVDQINLSSHKTKECESILNNLGLDGKVLIVIKDDNPVLRLASRNLPNVKILKAEGINVYDLLYFDKVLITKDAIKLIEERYKL